MMVMEVMMMMVVKMTKMKMVGSTHPGGWSYPECIRFFQHDNLPEQMAQKYQIKIQMFQSRWIT